MGTVVHQVKFHVWRYEGAMNDVHRWLCRDLELAITVQVGQTRACAFLFNCAVMPPQPVMTADYNKPIPIDAAFNDFFERIRALHV